ncbi:IclR family transcriptional regulator [Gordonia westfalica]|uniref:DNA-binding transcriptional regulator, IclR family n=1 Tax=Gordonia westfalica TaxID=158898 RepID=A0A1H2K438_9ACTN|nr:helix-turn-helix domain-containing protein [Gordonia westfalica]SDU63116.1 DNA-binding transcriptional regulator, IclR family [Gordonia westfalica]
MTPTVGDSSDARQPARAASPPTSRVVHIVELLAGADQPALTLAEIVRQTALSRATAHAIVAELTEHGWLSRDPATGRYGIGPGFLALARTAGDADHLDRWAGAAAHTLCDRFAIPFFVARRSSTDFVTLAAHAFPPHLAADSEPHPWFRNGNRIRIRPPICREFIAWDPSDARDAWISQAAEPTRTRLRIVLDVIADRGYSIERMTDDHAAIIEALNSLDAMPETLRTRVGDLLTELSVIDYLPDELDEEAGEGVPVVTIGAPIFDDAGRVIAAMVACPNTTLDVADLHSIADATRTAADEISSHLR